MGQLELSIRCFRSVSEWILFVTIEFIRRLPLSRDLRCLSMELSLNLGGKANCVI